MKIVVIGSNGQLGTDLVRALQGNNEVTGLTHNDIEVTDRQSCIALKSFQPDVIVNTAAFHKTDQCEDEPLKAFSVNSIGARNVASVSKEISAASVFLSTDYVFDGSKNEPYTENDVPSPINTYGISKLAGELFTRLNERHYVLRVASLFGVAGASGKGGNFIETMVAKARRNEAISVVDDMWMSPTYTKDAAVVMKRILESRLPFGTYHVTNTGFCTWFEFAKEIFRFTDSHPILTPSKTEEQEMKARRPRFSALESIKLPSHGIGVRNWKEALYDYLCEKGHAR